MPWSSFLTSNRVISKKKKKREKEREPRVVPIIFIV